MWPVVGGIAFVLGSLMCVYSFARPVSFEVQAVAILLLAGGLLVGYLGRKRPQNQQR